MRLYPSSRDALCKKVLAARFDARKEELVEKMRAESEKELEERLKGFDREALAEYLRYDSDIHIEGLREGIRASKPFPRKLCEYSLHVEMTKELSKLTKQYAELMKEREEYATRLKSVLNGCSTTKQLLDAVPELKPFLPPESLPCTMLVPVSEVKFLRADLARLAERSGKQ